jgi:threonine synthase
MNNIHCTNCRRPYPESGAPYRCPTCGGIFDFVQPLAFDPALVEPARPGIWRYRHALGLPADAPEISLGEGGTPLVWGEAFERRVAYKMEYANPSGSFKDRGSASLVSFLRQRGVTAAVEDSSGNAGASFAAYAARAGMQARVFVPEETSGPKRRQIAAYGAEITPVPGARSNATEAVRQAAEAGAVYASHAYLPFNLPGYATLAYELVEQLGGAPGTLILPVGQGGLLLGAGRGFAALLQAGLIDKMPFLVGVQARACAPLWAVSSYGMDGLAWVVEAPTVAEGVRTAHPLRGDAVLQMVESNGGTFVSVAEEAILPARDQLARQGLYVEATSALVWNALEQVAAQAPDPIVAVLTGSGLKSSA